MRKIFSLILTPLLVITMLSSVYHVAIGDSVYAQLYFQPSEQQPLDTLNNQPLDTFNNQPSEQQPLDTFNNQPLDTFNNQPLDTFNNQPLDTFNNQPLDTFNNQPTQLEPSPQQTPIRKALWTSASWSNGNERVLKTDQKDPYDSQFQLDIADERTWTIDGNGNAIVEQGGGSRGYIFTKNKDVQLTVFVIPNQSVKNIHLNVRTNHHMKCGFGGYQGYFSIEEQSVYFKKEPVHGWYSPALGTVSLKDAGLNEWKYGQKVGLRLEAKNIIADDGKEAVRISAYFNEAGDGIVWKKVTEWTDKQDRGKSSGLAEKDFDTNFKNNQNCKGKGDNMVESKEKALAPFLGTADALWIRVNVDDSAATTTNEILLSGVTVEDIGEEQQIPPQQMLPQPVEMPQQPLERVDTQPLGGLYNQPLGGLYNQIPEKNPEPLADTSKHNYGQKINDFMEELQASLFYQTAN